MTNPVIVKSSTVAGSTPTAVEIDIAEIAANLADKKIYSKRPDGTVIELGGSEGKEPSIASGTTAQYWRGDKSWRDFATDVRATVLTGLSTATNALIVATDTILVALGKLQAQISANLTTLTSHTGNTSNPHSVTKSQVGLGNVDNTSDANKPVSSAQQTALNLKMDKALPAWTDVSTFLNSWVNYGGGYANAGYYKDDHGVVHLKGFVKSGSLGVIYVLPVGYRPTYVIYIAVLSAQALGGLLIYPSGDVYLYFGSNAFVSLENIHFRTS